MRGLIEEKHITSAQDVGSNVIYVDFRKRVERTKGNTPAAAYWPLSVQVAWDLAH
jgi:hypothetical protein